MRLDVGINFPGRWQGWLFDSALTIGAVAMTSLVHFALAAQFAGRPPFLIALLAVLISATRGGIYQGIFATLLTLLLEISLWGEWSWLAPSFSSPYFVEIFLFGVEGVAISYLAEFYLNGRVALQHSQKRFQILFDAMPVGAIIHYQKRIIAVNTVFAEMFGYQQEELIGVKPTVVVAPESLEAVREHMRELSEDSYRITGLRRSGKTFPVEVIGKNINYQGHPMRATVMRDLTDSVIAHQRLEQMNELLEARVLERTNELNETVVNLRLALENVNTLSGLLPICGSCKRIRDDDGYWSQVEDYISAHSAAEFSHSLCPECLARLREEIADRQRRQSDRDAR